MIESNMNSLVIFEELRPHAIRVLFDDTVPRVDVDWIASIIREYILDGSSLEDGQLIEFGSMLFRMNLFGDELQFTEPDFRAMPIRWIPGLTNSLKLSRSQRDLAESFGLRESIDCPTLRESLVVGNDLDTSLGQFVMERSRSPKGDCGWFVGRGDTVLDYSNPFNLKRLSVYELIVNQPQLAPFLALPSGSRVESSMEQFRLSLNDQRQALPKGSVFNLGKPWYSR